MCRVGCQTLHTHSLTYCSSTDNYDSVSDVDECQLQETASLYFHFDLWLLTSTFLLCPLFSACRKTNKKIMKDVCSESYTKQRDILDCIDEMYAEV